MKYLARVETKLEARKNEAKRYNKNYPEKIMHYDIKRLPLLKGERKNRPREYLFIAIDDFSRELYSCILPYKTQPLAATFLSLVLEECPCTIECNDSDNGREYKGTSDHAFVALSQAHGIAQKFTRVKRPQTNDKAERVIKT